MIILKIKLNAIIVKLKIFLQINITLSSYLSVNYVTIFSSKWFSLFFQLQNLKLVSVTCVYNSINDFMFF